MRSITNVLQEPLGWDFAACACLHRLSIHPTTDRGKLQSLIADVTIERDLFAAGATSAFAGYEISKIRLVAALAAVHEIRAVAAETRLRVLLLDALHLLDGAAHERRRRETALRCPAAPPGQTCS